MKTIWKYNLIAPHATIEIPRPAQPRHVGEQEGTVCIWVEVDPDAETISRTFYIKGTGHPIADELTHLGSVIMKDALFVWHIYGG